MRVLFVSPYPPERDGIGTYCALMGGGLAEQGHSIAVISARRSQPARPEVIGSLPQRLGSTDSLISAVQSFAPDVIHVQFAIAAYGTLIPTLLRLMDGFREAALPVVITMHEVTRDTQSLRVAGRSLYRQIAQRASVIVVHTRAAKLTLERQVFRRPFPTRIIAHPRAGLPAGGIGADQLRERYGLDRDRLVLSFGFIDVDKGLDDLVSAVGRAPEGLLSNVRIAVAGAVRRRFGVFRIFEFRDRLYLKSVKRKVSALGLRERVLFVGFVPADEVRAWFEAATVAVLPYRRSEQSGVASLAMAVGTPLLTSDVGGLGEMSCIPPFPPADPDALAACLEQFLSQEGSRELPDKVGSDLSEIVAETTTLYCELASNVPAASLAR